MEKLLSIAKELSCKGMVNYVDDIYNLVKDMKEPLILELGTGCGCITMPLAIACIKNGGKIITVDNYSGPCEQDSEKKAKKKLKDNGLDKYIEFIKSDDLNEEFISKLSERQYDIIVVDSLHTYTHVILQLSIYEELLKTKGLFILHDTNYTKEIPEKRFNNAVGVMLAISKFLNHYDSFEVYQSKNDWPGFIVLQKE